MVHITVTEEWTAFLSSKHTHKQKHTYTCTHSTRDKQTAQGTAIGAQMHQCVAICTQNLFHASAMQERRLRYISKAAAFSSHELSSSVPVQSDTEKKQTQCHYTRPLSRHVTSRQRRALNEAQRKKIEVLRHCGQ